MPSDHATVHAVPELQPGSARKVWLAVGDDGWARMPLIIVRGAHPGPRVLVLAGQHGDEGYGMLAVQRVMGDLDPTALRGTVIAAPCLNVHAWCHGTRAGPFDGTDMNRVHPGDRGGTATQQLAAVLHDVLVPGADLVVDVHGGSAELGDIAFATLVRGADPDAAEVFEAALGVPRMLETGDPAAAPTGRFSDHSGATRLGILGIEACSVRATTTANVDEMAGYVRRALIAGGSLLASESDAVTPRPPERIRTVGVRSSAFGLFVATVDFSDVVSHGQHLGVVVDLFGDEVQRIEAPADGVVLVLRTGVWTRPGHLLVSIGSPAHA